MSEILNYKYTSKSDKKSKEMSHLFGDISEKTKMSPKVEPTKPGRLSGADVESKAQIPDILDIGLLRKRREVARGSFTRIIHTLQTIVRK